MTQNNEEMFSFLAPKVRGCKTDEEREKIGTRKFKRFFLYWNFIFSVVRLRTEEEIVQFLVDHGISNKRAKELLLEIVQKEIWFFDRRDLFRIYRVEDERGRVKYRLQFVNEDI